MIALVSVWLHLTSWKCYTSTLTPSLSELLNCCWKRELTWSTKAPVARQGRTASVHRNVAHATSISFTDGVWYQTVCVSFSSSLMEACYHGQLECAQLVVGGGASWLTRDHSGLSCQLPHSLQYASSTVCCAWMQKTMLYTIYTTVIHVKEVVVFRLLWFLRLLLVCTFCLVWHYQYTSSSTQGSQPCTGLKETHCRVM